MIRKFQDIHTHTHTCSLNSYTILLVFLQLDHTNDDIKSYYQQLLGIKHGTRTPIEMSYRQKLQTCSAYMLEAIRRSLPCFLSPSLTCKRLFFQNVIHVQPHGGKTLIVLYQKCGCKCGCMSACSRHATVRLVRPPSWNTILSQGKPCTCKNSLGTVRGISTVNSNVAWCRTVAWWLHVEMQQHLQPHFLVQYNGGFTTMWLHLDHVL